MKRKTNFKIKTINEFFNSEDEKGRYEIPYLKGEMGDIVKKDYKPLPQSTFFSKLMRITPLLVYFQTYNGNNGTYKIAITHKDILFEVFIKPVAGIYNGLGEVKMDGYYKKIELVGYDLESLSDDIEATLRPIMVEVDKLCKKKGIKSPFNGISKMDYRSN